MVGTVLTAAVAMHEKRGSHCQPVAATTVADKRARVALEHDPFARGKTHLALLDHPGQDSAPRNRVTARVAKSTCLDSRRR
jgi:hypothetical protein